MGGARPAETRCSVRERGADGASAMWGITRKDEGPGLSPKRTAGTLPARDAANPSDAAATSASSAARAVPVTGVDAAPGPPGPHQRNEPGPWPPAGTMRDVPAYHEPAIRAAPGQPPFDRGVGLEGYERQTGVAVPTHPALRLPGHGGVLAQPFGPAPVPATGPAPATPDARPRRSPSDRSGNPR